MTSDKTGCIPALKALADETRWRIVRELLAQTLTVTELTECIGASPYNVSKHLRILREAGTWIGFNAPHAPLSRRVPPGLLQRGQ